MRADDDYLDVVSGRVVSPVRVLKVAGALAAIAIIALAALWAFTRPEPTAGARDAQGASSLSLSVSSDAEGWDSSTSTPLIAVFEPEGPGDAFAAEAGPSADTAVEVPFGTWTLSFVTPVNADGSTYTTPDAASLSASEDGTVVYDGAAVEGGIDVQLSRVERNALTGEDAEAVVSELAAALQIASGPLEARSATLLSVAADALDTDDMSEAEDAASAVSAASVATSDGSSAAAGGSTSAAAGSSGSSNSAGSSSTSSSSSSHAHSWVAQTETVHHDAKYRTVSHAAVKERVTVCDSCGKDITGSYTSHKKSTGHTSYHYETRTIKAAYTEKVLVSSAWDETVTTGYKCSGCGASRSA